MLFSFCKYRGITALPIHRLLYRFLPCTSSSVVQPWSSSPPSFVQYNNRPLQNKFNTFSSQSLSRTLYPSADPSLLQLLTSFSKWTIINESSLLSIANTSSTVSPDSSRITPPPKNVTTSHANLTIPTTLVPSSYVPLYLQKHYEFRNQQTAIRFLNQISDIILRFRKHQVDQQKQLRSTSTDEIYYTIVPIVHHHTEHTNGTKVSINIYRTLADPSISISTTTVSTGTTTKKNEEETVVTQEEVNFALRMDEVAAELQLGGQWN